MRKRLFQGFRFVFQVFAAVQNSEEDSSTFISNSSFVVVVVIFLQQQDFEVSIDFCYIIHFCCTANLFLLTDEIIC